ncbi:GDSL lipase/esterase [Dillenia turbinata]|uniref:GDSL lipase/esterase n=1 Tax=Dillenia turbinata TaxID=194707 RepID=A0AAN8VP42_9MAGN
MKNQWGACSQNWPHAAGVGNATKPNGAATIYNPLLVQLIQQLNNDIGSDVLLPPILLNPTDFISNSQAFGFVMAKIACCGQGPYNRLGLCTAVSKQCADRSKYAFWDPFHPTEKAKQIIF